MTAVEDWVPQHDRQHPPFATGNQVALKHGAWSPAVVNPLAQELVDVFLAYAEAEVSPVSYLRDVTFRPSLVRWARTEMRAQRLEEWLLTHQEHCKAGCSQCQAVDRQLLAWTRLAGSQSAALGLDPASRAKLLKDGTEAARAGFDLDEVRAAGAATRQVAS